MTAEALEVLLHINDGYQIDYAPVTGGVGLRKGEVWRFIGAAPFIELKASGSIVHRRTQSQGHPIFHGRVDTYGAPEP